MLSKSENACIHFSASHKTLQIVEASKNLYLYLVPVYKNCLASLLRKASTAILVTSDLMMIHSWQSNAAWLAWNRMRVAISSFQLHSWSTLLQSTQRSLLTSLRHSLPWVMYVMTQTLEVGCIVLLLSYFHQYREHLPLYRVLLSSLRSSPARHTMRAHSVYLRDHHDTHHLFGFGCCLSTSTSGKQTSQISECHGAVLEDYSTAISSWIYTADAEIFSGGSACCSLVWSK